MSKEVKEEQPKNIKPISNIEDVRCSILEMRRNCLWEIRRQSHDISTIFESIDNNIKTNSSFGNLKK